MRSKNQVNLIGRIGKDPEFTTLDSGKMLSKTTLATSESWKNAQGERVEETEWHNLTFWGKLAELVNLYCKKGDMISVTGKIKSREYEKDGIKKRFHEIVCNDLIFLSSKDENTSKSNQITNEDDVLVPEGPGDDLPF